MRAKNGETDSDWSDPSDAVKTNAAAAAPTISAVAVTSTPVLETDTYGVGETIEVSVTFDEAVTATSDTDFVLSVGGARRAPLVRGSGTATLVFGYTVVSSDEDDDGIWIGDQDRTLVGNRNGDPQNGTITSLATSTAADLTHAELGQQSDHKVDGSRTPSNYAPVFDPATATRTVEENSAAGTNVGAVIPEATDADSGDTLTYSMEGTDAASFAFDASTRQITTIAGVTYNYEATKNSYSVTVKASDGTASATIAVTINVTDDDTEKSAKPDKPTLAKVRGSSTSLTATWTKPDLNGGTEIGGYDVAYRVGTTGTWELFEHVSSGLTTTITGLTADTSYQARVRAANHEAFSDWSDASDAVKTNAESGVDTAGVEGEFRLAPETVVDYADPDNDRHGGGTGPVEVYHAGAWGTVCRDGIRRSTVSLLDSDANGELIMGPDGNPTETVNDNEAAALICKAMNYDDGEYHMKYSKFLPGQAEADHQVADYWPPHSTYSGAATPIWLDDLRCVAGESALGTDPLPGAMSHCSYAGWGLHNCTHKEDAVVRCWNDDAAGAGLKSLKGRFVSPPERHDGTNRVKVRVAFSEPVEESPENVGAHGVEVEGGEVTSVSPVGGDAPDGAGTRKGSRSAGGRNAGGEDREVVWEFEIEPDSDGDLTVTLEAGRPCGEPGAICTADGRALSEGISTTVEGPEAPPPLTASFVGLPEAHDGAGAFTFRVAFSENIGISYRSLREDAFAVSGGRVTRGPAGGRPARSLRDDGRARGRGRGDGHAAGGARVLGLRCDLHQGREPQAIDQRAHGDGGGPGGGERPGGVDGALRAGAVGA